jgi:hypothetical protein
VRAATQAERARTSTAVERLRGVVYDPTTLATWATEQVGKLVLKQVSPARFLAVATRAAQRAQVARVALVL